MLPYFHIYEEHVENREEVTMGFGKLFIVSAPSGSGKTCLVKDILEECGKKNSIKRAVTYTTRPPREGEIDGEHYHFISTDEFKKKIDENYFLEWSTWYDYFYGSPASLLERIQEGISFVAILDRSGAKDVFAVYPHTYLIWIEPPSLEILKERLIKRGKDSEATIENRLRKASIEMVQEKQEQFYQYHIINDDYETAKKDLLSLFNQALGICS
ncbi:guanylate kinase [Candidatus Gracilibacteria bacterium]|nr:guanylate kinase [Candidatus Gracilibacteria bacterium]